MPYRMKDSADRVLRYLRDARRPVPSTELSDNVCLDYRKRISELKRAGYAITSNRVPGKPWNQYQLVLEVQG